MSQSAWQLARQRFLADRVGVVSLGVVAVWLVLVALTTSGLLASHWSEQVAVSHAPRVFFSIILRALLRGPAHVLRARLQNSQSRRRTLRIPSVLRWLC